jgi:hypothetical protein
MQMSAENKVLSDFSALLSSEAPLQPLWLSWQTKHVDGVNLGKSQIDL